MGLGSRRYACDRVFSVLFFSSSQASFSLSRPVDLDRIAGVPELWTIVGGCIVIAGIVLVVVYEHRRNKSEELLLAEMAAERRGQESVSTPVSQSFDADMREFAAHDFGDGSH